MSYRPYDRASRAMHRVLGSMEMADTLLRVCGFANRDAPAADAETKTKTNAEETFAASPSRRLDASAAESPLRSPARTRRGVVVEKASIDEVFVQLPSGCSLATHAAPCARAIRRAVAEKTGLVLSVGAARNKTLAKFASAAAKPDGVVVVAEQEDEQEDAGGNKDTSIIKMFEVVNWSSSPSRRCCVRRRARSCAGSETRASPSGCGTLCAAKPPPTSPRSSTEPPATSNASRRGSSPRRASL